VVLLGAFKVFKDFKQRGDPVAMTDLRSAIATLTTYACAWSAEEAAQLSGHSTVAVRKYLAILVREGVVVVVEGGWMAGQRAAEWRATKPKTKAGGNSREYRQRQAVRDALAARQYAAPVELPAATTEAEIKLAPLPAHLLAAAMGTSNIPIESQAKGKIDPPLRPSEARQILGCSYQWLVDLQRAGRLKCFFVGRNRRYYLSEILQMRAAR
jgi:hypothetical protein